MLQLFLQFIIIVLRTFRLAPDQNFLLERDRKINIADERRRVIVIGLNQEATAIGCHLNIPKSDNGDTFYIERAGDRRPDSGTCRILTVKLFEYAVDHAGDFHVIQIDRRETNRRKREQTAISTGRRNTLPETDNIA